MGCNPILEAFGNAKTVRNDNSSRFGKYVKIQVQKNSKKIKGAEITNYLLEKSRVTSQAKYERNYHIFYHLLGSNNYEAFRNFFLLDEGGNKPIPPQRFRYLNRSDCYQVESLNDMEQYQEVLKSFDKLKLSEKEKYAVWSILAAILHLGNLEFNDKEFEKKEEISCEITNIQSLRYVTTLLGINEKDLIQSLVMKTWDDKGVKKLKPMNINYCLASRDSLSKGLYEKLFNWLVKRMNMSNEDHNLLTIGLLDIFGFEKFDYNSLEQLCINFTNEKLHQLYIEYVFISEKNELIEQKLKSQVKNLVIPQDNNKLIELFEGNIFKLMKDWNKIEGDDYLCTKLRKQPNHPNLQFPQNTVDKKFIIKHTADGVEYCAIEFKIKNNDSISEELENVILESENKEISSIYKGIIELPLKDQFLEDMELSKQDTIKDQFLTVKAPFTFYKDPLISPIRTGKKEHSVSSMDMFTPNKSFPNPSKLIKTLLEQFENQMKSLMVELKKCDANFIRCIKPNEEKVKEHLRSHYVLKQIKYLGVLESVKIRKETFPFRKEFNNFWSQYKLIRPNKEMNVGVNIRKACTELLNSLIYHEKYFNEKVLIGETKIFLKQDFANFLDKMQLYPNPKLISTLLIIKQVRVAKNKKLVKAGMKIIKKRISTKKIVEQLAPVIKEIKILSFKKLERRRNICRLCIKLANPLTKHIYETKKYSYLMIIRKRRIYKFVESAEKLVSNKIKGIYMENFQILVKRRNIYNSLTNIFRIRTKQNLKILQYFQQKIKEKEKALKIVREKELEIELLKQKQRELEEKAKESELLREKEREEQLRQQQAQKLLKKQKKEELLKQKEKEELIRKQEQEELLRLKKQKEEEELKQKVTESKNIILSNNFEKLKVETKQPEKSPIRKFEKNNEGTKSMTILRFFGANLKKLNQKKTVHSVLENIENNLSRYSKSIMLRFSFNQLKKLNDSQSPGLKRIIDLSPEIPTKFFGVLHLNISSRPEFLSKEFYLNSIGSVYIEHKPHKNKNLYQNEEDKTNEIILKECLLTRNIFELKQFNPIQEFSTEKLISEDINYDPNISHVITNPNIIKLKNVALGWIKKRSTLKLISVSHQDKEDSKISKNISNRFDKFKDEKNVENQFNIAYDIVRIGYVCSPNIQDEIYYHCFIQTEKEHEKYLKLFAMITNTFPSIRYKVTIQNFLSSLLLETHSLDTEEDKRIKQYIRYCYKRIEKYSEIRAKPPSKIELKCSWDLQKIPIKIDFCNDLELGLLIESDTTIKTVIIMILKEIKADEGFAKFMGLYMKSTESFLDERAKIIDYVMNNEKIFFKIKVFVHLNDIKNQEFLNLLYIQLFADYMSGAYPCTLEKIMDLAALAFIIKKGTDLTEPESIPISKITPRNFQIPKEIEDFSKKLYIKYRILKDNNSLNIAKNQFFEHLKEYDGFMSQKFKGDYMRIGVKNGKSCEEHAKWEVLIYLRPYEFLLVWENQIETKREIFYLKDIFEFGLLKQQKAFFFRTLKNGMEEIHLVQTPQYEEIYSLIQGYLELKSLCKFDR